MRPFLAVLIAASLLSCAGAPAIVRAEEAKTASVKPGATTLVFFTDFQCPFCRKTHAMLAPLVAAEHDRVRTVYVHVPLYRHPDARSAARAAICVETLTKALLDDYAHALYTSDDLSEAVCEALAIERGVDKEKFEECLASPAVERRLDHDLATFREVDGDGVPLMYLGKERIGGMPSRASLVDAFHDAVPPR